jgi:hypothetical protein
MDAAQRLETWSAGGDPTVDRRAYVDIGFFVKMTQTVKPWSSAYLMRNILCIWLHIYVTIVGGRGGGMFYSSSYESETLITMRWNTRDVGTVTFLWGIQRTWGAECRDVSTWCRLIHVNSNEDHVSFDVLTSLQPTLSSTPVVFSVIIGVQLNAGGQVPIMYMFSVIWTLSHKTGVHPWSWCSIHPFPAFKTKLVVFYFTQIQQQQKQQPR